MLKGVFFMLESFSNHEQFYEERASRKEDFAVGLAFVFPEMIFLFILTDPYPQNAHSNPTLKFLHENFYVLPVVCLIVNLLIVFAFTQKRVRIAREALEGTLVDIEPRYEKGILTKVHPEDVNIGKPILLNFDGERARGDILFLKGARVAKVEKEEYTWTMPVDNPRDDGYGIREVSGTSTRTVTTLSHEGITYVGGDFGAQKEDTLDALVEFFSSNVRETRVRCMKTLVVHPGVDEEA